MQYIFQFRFQTSSFWQSRVLVFRRFYCCLYHDHELIFVNLDIYSSIHKSSTERIASWCWFQCFALLAFVVAGILLREWSQSLHCESFLLVQYGLNQILQMKILWLSKASNGFLSKILNSRSENVCILIGKKNMSTTDSFVCLLSLIGCKEIQLYPYLIALGVS